MISANRTTFSIAAIAIILMAALIWSLLFLADSSDEANRAIVDVAATQTLCGRIKLLKPTSLVSKSPGELATQLPGLIDDSIRAADIDAENLERISPQPARRIGDGDQSEMPFQLVFRDISLRQLLTFVTSLRSGNDWIRVRDLHLIHLNAAATPSATAQWNVEVTISYMTATPPPPAAASAN